MILIMETKVPIVISGCLVLNDAPYEMWEKLHTSVTVEENDTENIFNDGQLHVDQKTNEINHENQRKRPLVLG